MDSGEFWLWTLFFILLSVAITKVFCMCNDYPNYDLYPHLNDHPEQLYTIKVKPINSN